MRDGGEGKGLTNRTQLGQVHLVEGKRTQRVAETSQVLSYKTQFRLSFRQIRMV